MAAINELVLHYLYNLTVGRVWLEQLVTLASVYLGWAIIAIILIIFLRRQREQPIAITELIFATSTAGVAWLAAQLIKWWWPAARPFAELTDITPLISASGNAFPSGHAAFFFALALAVYVVDRKFGQWLIFGATIISLARIMAGIHWPLDILGGLALAIFTAAGALLVARLINPGFGHDR